MPPEVVLAGIAVMLAVALAAGYRLGTALSVLRALPTAATDAPRSLTDGDPIALTGELTVETPATMGEAAIEDTDRSVGAYLWRAQFPDNTNSNLTIAEWGWERQRWHTFAAGLESGEVGVTTDGQTVRVDPTWLQTATDADSLGDLTVGGVMKSDRFSISLWDSWYTYVRDHTTHRSLRRFAGYVSRHNDDIDLDRHLLETRPLLDGTTVSVSGELAIEQGEPVVRGSDATPLLCSDQGFDGHRRWLRRQALRQGGAAAGLVFLAVTLWAEWYLPAVVAIAGLLIYIGYRFTQDVHIIVAFLRRVFGDS